MERSNPGQRIATAVLLFFKATAGNVNSLAQNRYRSRLDADWFEGFVRRGTNRKGQ
jgi:hypothetical protein